MRSSVGRLGAAVLLAFGLAAPATAQGYQAINRLVVVPLGNGDFEVIEGRGEGARGIWCAAADYVKARNGAGANPRLYVKRARGPAVSVAGRKGVVFTTDAGRLPVAPSQSLSVTVRIPGVGLPTNHAIQFCKDYLIDLEDIFYRRKGS